LPEKIAKSPQLFLGLAIYLNAWHELDGERDRNTLEPIRRSSVFAYAEDYKLDELQREDLWFYVREMDREFLKWYKNKIPKTKQPDTPRASRYGLKGRRYGR
jgi:hypothetical protein